MWNVPLKKNAEEKDKEKNDKMWKKKGKEKRPTHWPLISSACCLE